jgi:hypothetical protein
MPKNEAKVSAVLEASKEILEANQGQMAYQAWRDALTEKIGAHEASLQHIMKNKLVFVWLKGFDENQKPVVWIVNDKSLIQPTESIVKKEGA